MSLYARFCNILSMKNNISGYLIPIFIQTLLNILKIATIQATANIINIVRTQ